MDIIVILVNAAIFIDRRTDLSLMGIGSRTKHPGTKHPMPFFYTLDKTPHKDLPPRTKHPTLFLSPRT